VSGLVGLYHVDGRPVDSSLLEKMTATLAHRGRDASGVWRNGSVGLGNCLHRTTPESLHEILPLAIPEKKLTITADARLDNREELIAALDVSDHTIPDSNLILLAYDKWGEACPEKLLGDFAFAIWDGQKQALFCARDHMGVRPFFYFYQPGRLFTCASEIKGVLCSPGVPRRLNEVRVAEHLVQSQDDPTNTFYRDILRLPPAHHLLVDRAGIRIQRYWALDPTRDIRLSSDQEYADAFRDLFTDAVRVRLRSAYPIGSLLSGGLDSPSITCVARNLTAFAGERPWKTFSAVFDDVPECNEHRFIQIVVEQGGIEPHYFHADRFGPLYDLDRMHWHQDEPIFAPNLYVHWGLYTSAQQQGTHVLLEGFDGDTTVSHGRAWLTELAASGRLIQLAQELRAASRTGAYRTWPTLRGHVIPPLVPEPLRRAWKFLHGRPVDGLPPAPAMRQDFAARIQWKQRLESLLGDRRQAPRSSRQDHYLRLNRAVMPLILELADRSAAAMSIEPRYPFFDRRLVEFCLALPPEQKLHQGWGRRVLRHAMEGILPDGLRLRPRKTGLTRAFCRGVMLYEVKKVEQVIMKDSEILNQYMDIDTLKMVYERSLRHASEEDITILWQATTLGLWLRSTGLQP